MIGQRSTLTAIVLLVVTHGLAGCAGSDSLSAPSAPSPVQQGTPTPPPQPRSVELAVFTDSTTGFSTSDVHDVQGQIVRFNKADELIWVANDTHVPEFIVDLNVIAYHHKADKFFLVRFGIRDGERRAYLSWPDDRLTIVDLWVDDRGDLKISETNVPVPETS